MIFDNEIGKPVETTIKQVVPDHFWMSAEDCLLNKLFGVVVCGINGENGVFGG